MKNLFLTLALLLTVSFAFANYNEISNLKTSKIEIDGRFTDKINSDHPNLLAYCEISDPKGFYGKGNCEKVLAAYRAWKAINNQ